MATHDTETEAVDAAQKLNRKYGEAEDTKEPPRV